MNNRINSTRFLSQEELASQLLELDINDEKYPSGGIPLLAMGDKVYVDTTDSHSIIFGATGSKKTRMFAMPSIGIFAKAGESFVVTDPKGELYQRTAGEVAQMGYDVCCLNLRDMAAGESWNPFYLPYKLYHSGDRAKAMELIQEMAVMMTDDSNDEKFWTNSTVDVLCGFIFYMFETEAEKRCTLLGLNKLWETYIESRRTFINKVDEKFADTMISRKLSVLNNASDKTVGSLEAVVSMALNQIMVNEEMIKYLSGNSICLEELAKKKSAIYLVIPDENKTYHFVVSLFLEQLYEVLIREAHSKKNNQLEIRMNFLIDEFANIPKLSNMDSMITASRSRNIRFHLIIQSMKQLRYKYDEYADVICSNCNNWIYLYSKEYELLQEISRLCGEIIYDNGIRVPLCSEFDLQHLNKEKGEALVLAGRNFPCLSNLKDVDEYPFAKGETALPVREKEQKPMYAKPVLPKEEEKFLDSKKQVAIVTLGPGNSILSVDTWAENDLKRCVERKKKSIVLIYGVREENISWSIADCNLEAEYRKRIRKESRFLTPDDFPEFEFETYIEAEKGQRPVDVFVVELWDHDGRTWVRDTLPDYGGEFGLVYAKKQVFTVVEKALKEMGCLGKRWEFGEDKPNEWTYTMTREDGVALAIYLRRNDDVR